MKLAYERPMMKAQAYHADEYVAACTIDLSKSLNIIWRATEGWGNWASTFIGDWFIGGGYWQNNEGYDTNHSFTGDSIKVEGGYSDGGFYWTTENTDESQGKTGKYYLQYSDAQQANNRMYQLWYESNESEGLQNVHEAFLRPDIGNGNDDRVAYVSVTEQENSVVVGS